MAITKNCPGCNDLLFDADPAYCQTCSNDEIYDGFTRKQLSEAFDRVKNPSNWKLAITADIEDAQWPATEAAICFYAGGAALATPTREGRLFVEAPGYYEIIGA